MAERFATRAGMAGAHSSFPPTQWTAIIEAARSDLPQQREQALGELCREYWRPLFAFCRQRGFERPDAEDLTQGFFAYLLQQNILEAARRDLGRLRTFLLTVFQRYIRDMREREGAAKRGGGQPLLELEEMEGETPLRAAETPEMAYDRSWAQAILRGALGDLGAAESAEGREKLFRVLEHHLNPEGDTNDGYEAAAAALEISGDAVRQAVSRLRKKFRQGLRERIARTLQQPTELQIDEELLALKAALRQ